MTHVGTAALGCPAAGRIGSLRREEQRLCGADTSVRWLWSWSQSWRPRLRCRPALAIPTAVGTTPKDLLPPHLAQLSVFLNW